MNLDILRHLNLHAVVARALAPSFAAVLCISLGLGAVSAQTESATAEDGVPVSEAPEESDTVPVPPVPVGANLTPPLGVLPPGPALISAPGSGQPGSSSVSMAPGTQTTGVATAGENAVVAPEAAPAPAPVAAPLTISAACAEYPTWYDAQLALESSLDEAVIAGLDPDGDAIACEEVMYP